MLRYWNWFFLAFVCCVLLIPSSYSSFAAFVVSFQYVFSCLVRANRCAVLMCASHFYSSICQAKTFWTMCRCTHTLVEHLLFCESTMNEHRWIEDESIWMRIRRKEEWEKITHTREKIPYDLLVWWCLRANSIPSYLLYYIAFSALTSMYNWQSMSRCVIYLHTSGTIQNDLLYFYEYIDDIWLVRTLCIGQLNWPLSFLQPKIRKKTFGLCWSNKCFFKSRLK